MYVCVCCVGGGVLVAFKWPSTCFYIFIFVILIALLATSVSTYRLRSMKVKWVLTIGSLEEQNVTNLRRSIHLWLFLITFV